MIGGFDEGEVVVIRSPRLPTRALRAVAVRAVVVVAAFAAVVAAVDGCRNHAAPPPPPPPIPAAVYPAHPLTIPPEFLATTAKPPATPITTQPTQFRYLPEWRVDAPPGARPVYFARPVELPEPMLHTLHLHNVPADVAFARLGEQCGVRLHAVRLGEGPHNRMALVSVDADAELFGVILSRLCLAAGARPAVAQDVESELSFVPGRNWVTGLPPSVCGPITIVPSAHRVLAIGGDRLPRLRASLEIAILSDPAVRILGIGAVRVDGVDAAGGTAPQWLAADVEAPDTSPEATGGTDFPGRVRRTTVCWLPYGTGAPPSPREVRGHVRMLVEAVTAPVRFDLDPGREIVREQFGETAGVRYLGEFGVRSFVRVRRSGLRWPHVPRRAEDDGWFAWSAESVVRTYFRMIDCRGLSLGIGHVERKDDQLVEGYTVEFDRPRTGAGLCADEPVAILWEPGGPVFTVDVPFRLTGLDAPPH